MVHICIQIKRHAMSPCNGHCGLEETIAGVEDASYTTSLCVLLLVQTLGECPYPRAKGQWVGKNFCHGLFGKTSGRMALISILGDFFPINYHTSTVDAYSFPALVVPLLLTREAADHDNGSTNCLYTDVV